MMQLQINSASPPSLHWYVCTLCATSFHCLEPRLAKCSPSTLLSTLIACGNCLADVEMREEEGEEEEVLKEEDAAAAVAAEKEEFSRNL